MNRNETNVIDTYCLESLSYLNEENEKDKPIDGKPVSKEIIENSKNKGVIGKIGGIGADSNAPTRNGRRYPLELWQNVEKSEYFIEGMENRSIIGEADHPEERLDFSVKEGAVVLTKYEIQNDGKVYTEFDILDTMPGRTVKTYFDAGCKLGVSSRGLGEEIMENGEKIIDPDTYQFYCFDVVAFPAVKSARMELIESTSPKRESFITSIKNEISKCTSVDEVRFIESISRGADLYLDEFKEAIEQKLIDLGDGYEVEDSTGNVKVPDKKEVIKNMITTLLTDSDEDINIDELVAEIKSEINQVTKDDDVNSITNVDESTSKEKEVDLNNKIKISEPNNNSDEDTPEVLDRDSDKQDLEILAELQEAVKAKDIQLEQKNTVIKNLLAKKITMESTIKESTESSNKLVESNESITKTNENLLEEINNLKNQLTSVTKKYENLQKVNNEFSTIVEKLNDKYVAVENHNASLVKLNKALESDNSNLSSNLSNLEESLKTEKAKLTEGNITLSNEKSSLSKSVESLKRDNDKLSTDNQNLSSKLESVNKQFIESLDKYIEMTCGRYNLDEATLRRMLGETYTIADIDKVANELVENISKLNALPFSNLIPNRTVYVENVGLQNNINNTEVNENLETFDFMLNGNK